MHPSVELEPASPAARAAEAGSAETILAIDPGNIESAWVVIEAETCRPTAFGKVENADLRDMLRGGWRAWDGVAIEMIASYGMPVGAEVFETCVAIGRFVECLRSRGIGAELVKRLPIKQHLCHSSRATDATVRQALVDRFASGQSNHGKGTKAAPGWFYGFHADVWAAYALAVYAADTMKERDQDG